MMTNPVGRITQGQFSFLPDLSDEEIAQQIQYGLNKGYAWSVEYTDDPHPRNTYWEMFGLPMFDLIEPPRPGEPGRPPKGASSTRGDPVSKDAAGVLAEVNACRQTFPQHYVRLMAFDATRGVESIAMSFIVNRPDAEPGFGLQRQEVQGRTQRYTVRGYAAEAPESQRYHASGSARGAR